MRLQQIPEDCSAVEGEIARFASCWSFTALAFCGFCSHWLDCVSSSSHFTKHPIPKVLYTLADSSPALFFIWQLLLVSHTGVTRDNKPEKPLAALDGLCVVIPCLVGNDGLVLAVEFSGTHSSEETWLSKFFGQIGSSCLSATKLLWFMLVNVSGLSSKSIFARFPAGPAKDSVESSLYTCRYSFISSCWLEVLGFQWRFSFHLARALRSQWSETNQDRLQTLAYILCYASMPESRVFSAHQKRGKNWNENQAT